MKRREQAKSIREFDQESEMKRKKSEGLRDERRERRIREQTR